MIPRLGLIVCNPEIPLAIALPSSTLPESSMPPYTAANGTMRDVPVVAFHRATRPPPSDTGDSSGSTIDVGVAVGRAPGITPIRVRVPAASSSEVGASDVMPRKISARRPCIIEVLRFSL